jgi:hypothetical protein
MRIPAVAVSLLGIAAFAGAAPSPRPSAGIGVVVIAAESPKHSLPVYERPGVRRIGELEPEKLQGVVPVGAQEASAAVTHRKDDWVRVICDGNGREGWIRMKPSWRYHPWREILVQRPVVLPGGLRQEAYLERSGPDPKSPSLGSLPAGKPLRVTGVEGDWAKVGVKGWIRWRDDSGYLLVLPGADR